MTLTFLFLLVNFDLCIRIV